MRILAVNCGSSSIKCRVVDDATHAQGFELRLLLVAEPELLGEPPVTEARAERTIVRRPSRSLRVRDPHPRQRAQRRRGHGYLRLHGPSIRAPPSVTTRPTPMVASPRAVAISLRQNRR